MGLSEDADDDEEDEPAFMPFSSGGGETHHDPSATLRGDPRGVARRTAGGHRKVLNSQTSDSSASSAAPAPITRRGETGRPGPLSPKRTAELAGRSPGIKGKREGSEGSPSMGSSFSDLDGWLTFFF